ncbi:MAG: GNAT family N-acetyltransferase [Bosea sp. (in: a-proteobacteria)]
MPLASDARLSPPLVDLRSCSVSSVLALNNAHQIETSALDAASYARLLDAAGFASAVGSRPDAFLIAFNEASVHDNDNLAWFRQRHERFVYVDRIIVAEHARGLGLARALYAALVDHARGEGRLIVGCEINVTPPNPGSDALHQSLGFAEIGRRELSDDKVIRYMRLDLG